MKVVYFGTPEFSARVLEYLIQNSVDVVAVISKPDRPKGRSGYPLPTAVKAIIQEKFSHIPLHQPEVVSDTSFADVLKSYNADLFVVVAYGEILKQHVLDMPKVACINLHTSLLPKYRGAAPIQRAIMNGETESGVTIMHMVKKMDAGDMIEQIIVPISDDMTFGELEEKLCVAGEKALLEVINRFKKGQPAKIAQDEMKVSIAPKIELEDCQIDWNRSAHELHNLVRGVNPYPVAWCYVKVKGEKKRLKILRTKVVEMDLRPAQLDETQKSRLIVGCGKGAIELLEVQLEGKKTMSAADFLRGVSIDNLTMIV